MVCINNTFSSEIGSTSSFLGLRISSLFFSKSSKTFFFCFCLMLLLHLITHQLFLFILLFLQSFLFKNHLPLNLRIFKILLSLQLPEFFRKMVKQRGDILIGSQLPPVCYDNSTKWAFFLALTIVSFNTVGTESMYALLVLHRIVYHLLTNGTCQSFLNPTNEILSYHIVKSDELVAFTFSIKCLISLIRFMINDFTCFFFVFAITKFEFETFLFQSFKFFSIHDVKTVNKK